MSLKIVTCFLLPKQYKHNLFVALLYVNRMILRFGWVRTRQGSSRKMRRWRQGTMRSVRWLRVWRNNSRTWWSSCSMNNGRWRVSWNLASSKASKRVFFHSILLTLKCVFTASCASIAINEAGEDVFTLMQPSMGILTLPCPRVVKHSASTRRRIFTYKKSRLDESLPYLFLAAVNLHRTSLWGMVNLYLIMLIV